MIRTTRRPDEYERHIEMAKDAIIGPRRRANAPVQLMQRRHMDENIAYRRDMKDAGRGRLLKP